MNFCKSYKMALLILFFQFNNTVLQGITIKAPVNVYFLPDDTENFRTELKTLLNKAENQILIAMYWLTDQEIIKKITSLKKEINIQIILDESINKYYNIDALIKELTKNENQIITYVLPSNKIKKNMHNKFLVIDNKLVITGSANFTKRAIDPNSEQHNEENVLIINSKELAQQYSTEFYNIKKNITETYANLLSSHQPSIPWLIDINTDLYQNDLDYKNYLKFYYYKSNSSQYLKNYFPDIDTATEDQKKFLRGLVENVEEMSYEEAQKEIEYIDKTISDLEKVGSIAKKQKVNPKKATEDQKKFLRGLVENVEEMSYEEAQKEIEYIDKTISDLEKVGSTTKKQEIYLED